MADATEVRFLGTVHTYAVVTHLDQVTDSEPWKLAATIFSRAVVVFSGACGMNVYTGKGWALHRGILGSISFSLHRQE